MKKLPKITQNEIKKQINNNKIACKCEVKEKLEKNIIPDNQDNITKILNKIFSGLGYSYNIPVNIITKDKEYNTSLITKTKDKIITLDNEIINIADIISIKEN